MSGFGRKYSTSLPSIGHGASARIYDIDVDRDDTERFNDNSSIINIDFANEP